ncbi:hypothetical protein G6O69_37195 [Pseudenhygromyxa sp. WMMC2535]|uniref:hypothetical protein n=1 Tax=Pseudenhygromyxa sp. WMMC2535 TaxID=2712867 RepID=UPI001558170F|nr:hypothetical protein [Pseudenhygromyxa sp. WMMC2535]NVB40302.1 hypothetical protein [Pseudenhygromyxa sp. WMMC2535]NVB43515.1 hypothetical protein [Pseudenhygromyxa sp. WMMC2535]
MIRNVSGGSAGGSSGAWTQADDDRLLAWPVSQLLDDRGFAREIGASLNTTLVTDQLWPKADHPVIEALLPWEVPPRPSELGRGVLDHVNRELWVATEDPCHVRRNPLGELSDVLPRIGCVSPGVQLLSLRVVDGDAAHPRLSPVVLLGGRRLRALRKAGVGYVFAHRQSSSRRGNDPEPEIWHAVGQWAVTALGMSDGGPGYAVGTGAPIPDAWRRAPTLA